MLGTVADDEPTKRVPEDDPDDLLSAYPQLTAADLQACFDQNSQALASVKQGLKESAEGKRIYRGSFAKHAKE